MSCMRGGENRKIRKPDNQRAGRRESWRRRGKRENVMQRGREISGEDCELDRNDTIELRNGIIQEEEKCNLVI